MAEEKEKFWETIISISHGVFRPFEFTSRAKVPHGWLLRYEYLGGASQSAHSITFIPDRDNSWHKVGESLKWELIHFIRGANTDCRTYRLKVPGGWVVRDAYYFREHLEFAMIFVPDPNHSWEIQSKRK
jgi:hypothetical protein